MNPANFLRDTVDLVRQIETRFLELGARLFLIQEKEIWKDGYESFGEFVDAAGLRRPFASQLTTIHKVYVVQGRVRSTELAKVGYQKLYDAIPLIEKEGVQKAVTMARTLSLGELREEVREEKHGECLHKEIIKICATCHKRVE